VDEHRHRWSVVDFYVEQDRPMMRQACACGAMRAIRAWDRSWQPPNTGDEATAHHAVPDPGFGQGSRPQKQARTLPAHTHR
jgi:hypothetical protein